MNDDDIAWADARVAELEALDEARARIAELEAALRPFALAADVTDDLAAGIGLDEIMSSLSIGDLRAARAALSGEGVTE